MMRQAVYQDVIKHKLRWRSDGHVLMKCVLLSDVVSIEKTSENFRLIYDVKGRFTVHRITDEEAKVSSVFL